MRARPLIFFDLETTGLDVNRDRIIEIAAQKCVPQNEDGKHGDMIEMRFNPGRPIPAASTAIHGITDADVRDELPFAERAAYLHDFFSGCDLAGFNIRRFDVQMLMVELDRAGHPLSLDGVHVIDCCDIFHKREPRTLEAAVRFYCGREHTGAHRAMHDVIATMEVFVAQLARYTDLPRDVEGLHAAIADQDAVDLAGKLRWDDGYITIAFGKYKGTPLHLVPQIYLLWMKESQIIGPDAAWIIEEVLVGKVQHRGGE